MSLSMYSHRLFITTIFAASAGTLLPAFAADFTSERVSISAEGQGKDVVLIHGLGSSPRVWRELVKAVPGYRYHLVQIHGFAGHARGKNSDGAVAAPVAEEIARYIAASKLDKPAVIGHSMGGSIGIMLTGRNPGAVSKLMVVDMMPFLGAMFGGPNATPDSVKPMADALKAQMLNPDQAARQARTTATIDGMVNTVAMRAGALEDSLKSDQDVVARGFHELVVTDLRAELEKITVPATVLYVTPKGAGMTDERIDAAYKASYAPLKGVTLKRIASSAHFIMWDQSEQFQAEVKGFLAR
jgi:pimeloyl-ACP methyl ester carboxylesterase